MGPHLEIPGKLSDSERVKIPACISGLIAALFLFCLCGSSSAATDPWKEKPTCVFGMPYMAPAVQSHERGIINEILKTVFEPAGIMLRHENMSYRQAIKSLAAETIDCTLDIVGSGKKLMQGRVTMLFYDLSAAHLKETPWKGVRSLSGKYVAYRYGFNLASLLPVKYTLRQVYSLSSAFLMLEKGQADYALDSDKLLVEAMRESHSYAHHFTISPIKSYEVRPAFAKNEHGRRLRAIYEQRMKQLAESGKLKEILEKNGLDAVEAKRILDTF